MYDRIEVEIRTSTLVIALENALDRISHAENERRMQEGISARLKNNLVAVRHALEAAGFKGDDRSAPELIKELAGERDLLKAQGGRIEES